MRDILEELESGRHDFLPISIKTERAFNGMTDHGNYYLIISPPRLDAIVIAETQFSHGYGQEGFERSGHISSDRDDPCVLDGRVIAGHHFWQLPRKFAAKPQYPYSGQTAYFCSDELWQRICAEKLKGWDIEKICTVKIVETAIEEHDNVGVSEQSHV